jgi:hypothetical protein
MQVQQTILRIAIEYWVSINVFYGGKAVVDREIPAVAFPEAWA